MISLIELVWQRLSEFLLVMLVLLKLVSDLPMLFDTRLHGQSSHNENLM